MALEQEISKLSKRGLISDKQQQKLAGAIMYKTMGADDAEKFLADHQKSGGFGYITPLGRDGIYGHQVTYWRDE